MPNGAFGRRHDDMMIMLAFNGDMKWFLSNDKENSLYTPLPKTRFWLASMNPLRTVCKVTRLQSERKPYFGEAQSRKIITDAPAG